MFKAEIIADSINDAEVRITTFQLRYPRFIHSEVMTHRVFSRNARSSRAVPTEKLIEEVNLHPAMPVHWGANQTGMQAREELNEDDRERAKFRWLDAATQAVEHAKILNRIGAHKQIVNRVLEPFTWIDVVVTATEWQNWYGLRVHPDAQPEIQHLASLMYEAHKASVPVYKKEDEWHLPYITEENWPAFGKWVDEKEVVLFGGYKERQAKIVHLAKKISTARCARVSFKAFDGSHSPIEKDLELFDKLMGSQPCHASPAEHQAKSDPKAKYKNEWGNYNTWAQFRKLSFEGESRAPFDMSALTYRVIEGGVYKCVSR
jgi:hypothetical protein